MCQNAEGLSAFFLSLLENSFASDRKYSVKWDPCNRPIHWCSWYICAKGVSVICQVFSDKFFWHWSCRFVCLLLMWDDASWKSIYKHHINLSMSKGRIPFIWKIVLQMGDSARFISMSEHVQQTFYSGIIHICEAHVSKLSLSEFCSSSDIFHE